MEKEKHTDSITLNPSPSPSPSPTPTPDPFDDHNPHLSFRRVEAVDVSVRSLCSTIKKNRVPRFWNPQFWTGGRGEDVRDTKILDNVSADMPAGQLMAIVGGSGSGKVCFLQSVWGGRRRRGWEITVR